MQTSFARRTNTCHPTALSSQQLSRKVVVLSIRFHQLMEHTNDGERMDLVWDKFCSIVKVSYTVSPQHFWPLEVAGFEQRMDLYFSCLPVPGAKMRAV